MAEEDEVQRVNSLWFCKRIWAKYDRTFLVAYAVIYANAGLKFLQMLAVQDLFKNYYKLEPSKSQFYITMSFMPWMFKFFYGVIVDSVYICGSRKKAWILIGGLVQTVALSIAALCQLDSVELFMALILLNSLAGAFLDVVIDSMMVMQARRDPK